MDEIWVAQADVPKSGRRERSPAPSEPYTGTSHDHHEIHATGALREARVRMTTPLTCVAEFDPQECVAIVSSPRTPPPATILDNDVHNPKFYRRCDDVDFFGGYDSTAETVSSPVDADGAGPAVLDDELLEDALEKSADVNQSDSDDDENDLNEQGLFGRIAGLYRRTRAEVNVLLGGCGVACSPSSASSVTRIGAKLKNCEVSFEDIEELHFLGSGATGCVFLGRYNDEEVAVKKFKDNSPMLAESKQIKSLTHENIVRFVGMCTKPPVYCIVMEYCPTSLYDIIKDCKIPPHLMCEYARQIACGMQYLHSKNQIHRDLKSPNVLMGQDGKTLKISDFGTARSFSSKSTTMSFCGSVAWMAPEMIRSEPCGAKVDVWSYGVVLWELLTGEVPYMGVDQGAIVYGIGTESLHLPVPSTAPLGFSLLLKQCWNDEAKHRPKFRQILLHLEILQDDDAFAVPDAAFYATQRGWREEMAAEFEKMKQEKIEMQRVDQELLRRRDEELSHAQDVRQLYEARLDMVSNLIADLRARGRDLDQREKQVRMRTKARATSKRSTYTKNTTARRRSKEAITRRKSDATDSGVESRASSNPDTPPRKPPLTRLDHSTSTDV
eukprot:m.474855 g.474855  ORF g.474855 m.474855 type:complete len:611 (-) comp21683_c0_seq1:201-2033(-)